jgi:zinc finger protein
MYELSSRCKSPALQRVWLLTRMQGMTRILPIKVPHFKEILLESFECTHCDTTNKTVKSAGQIQEKGTKYKFRIETPADFQRQVVRGDNGVLRIEDLELETPNVPGQYTNLEGVFTKVVTDLEADQPARKDAQPEMHAALHSIIQKLKDYLSGTALPVTVSLDDPTGNSFIEPSIDDFKDSKYTRSDYPRTHQQNVQLGLVVDDSSTNGTTQPSDPLAGVDIVDDQIYELPAECPACAQSCTVNMKKTKIPHFKDVIIMATVCEHCGYRTSDVKTGGEVPEKGRRITLQVKSKEDLSRDILKSETCALKSPTLGLEVQSGTLGGRFTTVEGLLSSVRDQLHGQVFDTDGDLAGGDSMTSDTKSQWDGFFDKINKAINAEIEFEVMLEDPLANSFVQSLKDEGDEQITTENYERTHEEMEELGLNDMVTEGYETEHETAVNGTEDKDAKDLIDL